MKQRTTIILVFTVFLAPVVLATLMHSQWWQFEPETRNYGELVEPVVPLTDFAATGAQGQTWTIDHLRDHWTLLAVSDQPCDNTCAQRLTWLARLRETQGRHRDRLQVMVVAPDTTSVATPPQQPGVMLGEFSAASGATADADISTHRAGWLARRPAGAGLETTYLVDPAGNIIMVYPAAADPTGIRKDLKRILTWSKADNV